jgi:hypothetical protein
MTGDAPRIAQHRLPPATLLTVSRIASPLPKKKKKPPETHLWQLPLEHIDLVQQQDHARVEEPARVDDGLE